MVMVMLIEKVEHFEQLVMKKVEQLKQLKMMEKGEQLKQLKVMEKWEQLMVMEKGYQFQQLMMMEKVEQLKHLRVMEKDFLLQIGVALKCDDHRHPPNLRPLKCHNPHPHPFHYQ